MTDRRRTGTYYTPPDLADLMAGNLLDAWFASPRGKLAIPTVLDPACGEGALLLAIGYRLGGRATPNNGAESGTPNRSPADSLQPLSARNVLHGVDTDGAAVVRLRLMLAATTGSSKDDAWLQTQFAVGDALTGPGFFPGDEPLGAGLNWRKQFPSIAAAGGFDLIVGNPPYIRERDSKALFDRLRTTRVGAEWRAGRMDLWHYFLHRSLDLLKPGGLLTFVVPSYWTHSTGASPLLERLQRETHFEHLVLLENRPLFAGVQGRHLVFLLRKNSQSSLTALPPCRVRSLSPRADLKTAWNSTETGLCTQWWIPADELIRDGRLEYRTPAVSGTVQGTSLWKTAGLQRAGARTSGGIPLGHLFEVRQGIAENPPRISASLARRWSGRFTPGEGVFVLTPAEVERMELLPHERGLLRPYYDPADIECFRLPANPRQWLLYLTRGTAPTLEALPAIGRHLERFQTLLSERREVRLGRIAWWHLHWPREERLFLAPRLLGVQMGRGPRFAWVERPAFSGFSTHVIVRRPEIAGPPLPVLAALLNDGFAVDWFERHAKHRGAHLDIGGGVLREFPLPPRNETLEGEIEWLVREETESEVAGGRLEEISRFSRRLRAGDS